MYGLLIKIQLIGLEWNKSLSSDTKKCPTKKKNVFVLFLGSCRTESSSNGLRVDVGRQQDPDFHLSAESGRGLDGDPSHSDSDDQAGGPQNGLAEEPVPVSLLPRWPVHGTTGCRCNQGKKSRTKKSAWTNKWTNRPKKQWICFVLTVFLFQGTRKLNICTDTNVDISFLYRTERT